MINDTYEVQNEVHAKLIKEYIPEEIVDGKPMHSKFHLYIDKRVLKNCTSSLYDKSIFQTTITSDVSIFDIYI